MAVSSTPTPVRLQPLVPAWAWWLLVLACVGAIAVLTLESVNYSATFVAVVIVPIVYVRSRTAGLALAWGLWLILPALRRMIGISEGFADADPLAVAPFAALAIVGLVELSRAKLSFRAKAVLFMALAGVAFGAPAGAFRDPLPAAYALFAYSATILAFAVGYREPRNRDLSLTRVLLVAAVPLSVYGILQIFAPLTPWDHVWLESVDFVSLGDKDEGTLRAFSTLNSTGTFALVLGLTVLLALTARRFGPLNLAILLVTLASLALTLVRGVWVALALVLIILLVTMPRRVGWRVVVVVVVGAVALPAIAGGTPAGSSVGDRALTLGGLSSDTSAQARIATPSSILPVAIRQPLGVGLGTAGEASRLGDRGGLRASDNAILAITLQSGAVGLILVLSAVVLGTISAVRNVRRRRSPNDIAVLSCLMLLLILMLTGDVFYGVSGAVIWYLIGFAVRGDDPAAAPATT